MLASTTQHDLVGIYAALPGGALTLMLTAVVARGCGATVLITLAGHVGAAGRRARTGNAARHQAVPLGLATHRSSWSATMRSTGCRYTPHHRQRLRSRVLPDSANVLPLGSGVVWRSDKIR